MKNYTNFSCCYGIHNIKCSNRARKKINPEFNKWSSWLAGGFNKPQKTYECSSTRTAVVSPYVADLE
jgi:hypothetical protein